MITNHTAYKYEIPNKVPFVITQYFTNGTVNLQCGVVQIKYNICLNNPYKYDTKVEYYGSKIFMTMSTYELPVMYLSLKPKI